MRHPPSADFVTVALLREQLRDLVERYDREPSTPLLAETGQRLGQVAFLRGQASTGRVRRELYAVEAESATLMGQLVWDASQRRDHASARAHMTKRSLLPGRWAIRRPRVTRCCARASLPPTASATRRRALGAAESRFERIEPDDLAGDLFSSAQFDRLAGSCYLVLGEHWRAQSILEGAASALHDRKQIPRHRSGKPHLGPYPSGAFGRGRGNAS